MPRYILELVVEGAHIFTNIHYKFQVKSEYSEKILHLLQVHEKVNLEKRLLMVSFTSLVDYMWYLRSICERLGKMGTRVLLYLAAAVSDFYIPVAEMPQHKMQSSEGAPKLQLQLVPKMLHPLVKYWVPNAYVISFKLETDPSLLEDKARKALETYHHNMVIANILKDRKWKVTIIERPSDCDKIEKSPIVIELSDTEMVNGVELEEKIVTIVCKIHDKFSTSVDSQFKR